MKIKKEFYLRPAQQVAKECLGKYLVYNSPKGKISGMISDVEAYPAFVDEVSHGNKRTKRTEIMYQEGGLAYIYIIYGIHHQLGVVVNRKDVPEAILIRAVIPEEGIKIMKINFHRLVDKISDLTKSPGNLCKSFGINMSHYGLDLTGNQLWLEDRGVVISTERIQNSPRVGINPKLKGSDLLLRYYLSAVSIDEPMY